jgi:hypothetical protein
MALAGIYRRLHVSDATTKIETDDTADANTSELVEITPALLAANQIATLVSHAAIVRAANGKYLVFGGDDEDEIFSRAHERFRSITSVRITMESRSAPQSHAEFIRAIIQREAGDGSRVRVYHLRASTAGK